MQDTQPKQIKLRSAIGLPLDEFESIDLALGLPIAVLRREGRTHGIVVPKNACSKAPEFGNATLLCFLQPTVQDVHLSIDKHRSKILRELIGACQAFVLDAQWFELPHLPQRELARIADEEPGGFTSRKRQRGTNSYSLLLLLVVHLQPLRVLAKRSEILMHNRRTPAVAPCTDLAHQVRDVVLPGFPALMQIVFVGIQFTGPLGTNDFRIGSLSRVGSLALLVLKGKMSKSL